MLSSTGSIYRSKTNAQDSKMQTLPFILSEFLLAINNFLRSSTHFGWAITLKYSNISECHYIALRSRLEGLWDLLQGIQEVLDTKMKIQQTGPVRINQLSHSFSGMWKSQISASRVIVSTQLGTSRTRDTWLGKWLGQPPPCTGGDGWWWSGDVVHIGPQHRVRLCVPGV